MIPDSTRSAGGAWTEHVSANTDDLDQFAEHGNDLQEPLLGLWTTLAHQRNYLLGTGLRAVVGHSEITTLDDTIGFMADLDRFVGDISTALRRFGDDQGSGRFEAPAVAVDRLLDRSEELRLDDFERALGAALERARLGTQPAEVAAEIRREIEAILEYDPRFDVDGATVSEPNRLAAAIVDGIGRSADDLIDRSRVRSSSLHAEPTVSIEVLAAELHYGHDESDFAPADAVRAALGQRLGQAGDRRLTTELGELHRREQLANLSLVADAQAEVELDGETGELNRAARELFEQHLTDPGMYDSRARLDEPEVAYQLQKLAAEDPGRALGVKLMLGPFLQPKQHAEIDRVLATGGSFGDRIDLATAHPVDGMIGAVKGVYNENFGWWTDLWADTQVAIVNGLYGLATNATGSEYGARVPETWAENASIVDLELEMDNAAQQGGADAAFAVELVSGLAAGGKAGLGIVRIGRRYFLRSGDELVAGIGPRLATQLDEAVEAAQLDEVTELAEAAETVGATPLADRPANSSSLVRPVAPLPQADDVVVIRARDYKPVPIPGRPGHALDGNINGFGRASGGHYLRSSNLRVVRVIDVAPNGVIQAEIAIRGAGGRWIPRIDRRGHDAVITLFPRHWSRRRTLLEIDTAFRNSVPRFAEGQPPGLQGSQAPWYWVGRASDGTLIRGLYTKPGVPSFGWDSAYPVFERR